MSTVLKEKGYELPALDWPMHFKKAGYVCAKPGPQPWNGQSKDFDYLHRLLVMQKLGRPLITSETVKFRDRNRKRILLDNLNLYSSEASCKELLTINGPPIYGYTHCLCKCGEALPEPWDQLPIRSYIHGHSPSEKGDKQSGEKIRELSSKLALTPQPKKRKRKARQKKEQPMEKKDQEVAAVLEERVSHGMWEELKQEILVLIHLFGWGLLFLDVWLLLQIIDAFKH